LDRLLQNEKTLMKIKQNISISNLIHF